MSAEKFQKLGSRIALAIFYGDQYCGWEASKKGTWKVQVEFRDENGTMIKFEENQQNLEIALQFAYNRLDLVATKGLGFGAMLPAIEHKPELNLTDDEIPF